MHRFVWQAVWAACVMTLGAGMAHAASAEAASGIAVQGEAEVRVLPDRAELSVAVEAQKAEADAASKAAEAAAARFLAAARALGAEDRAIQSTSLRLSPEYRWDEERRQQVQIGYRARRDISVQIEQLERLPEFLKAATEAGMTHIAPPRLYAHEAKLHQREALRLAMGDARANAEAIAAASGKELGGVISVDARDEQHYPVEPRAMMRASADQMESQEASAFSAGEIVYRARLRARFAFMP
ncbi:SIMPL domain-containing protein [Algiphilus sp.]|uniref:SIMPL domain-containing protein n=1 Tax=Algiphilus sp. TaxID=1872431 RepID=UPI003B52FBD7